MPRAGGRLRRAGRDLDAWRVERGDTDYAAQCQQLFRDLDADTRTASGQPQPVHFSVCLAAVPEIAQAQRDVAAKLPTVHIACDNSALAKSGGLHLTATASRQAGQALGGATSLLLHWARSKFELTG